jgi:hypothetical protein
LSIRRKYLLWLLIGLQLWADRTQTTSTAQSPVPLAVIFTLRVSTFLLITIALFMAGLFSFFKKKPSGTIPQNMQLQHVTQYDREEAEKFVNNLEKLGYFKYAEPTDVAALKENMIKEYDPNNELVSIWDENSPTPKDFRYYFCDNETLFEEGGFTDMLKDLQPTFDKLELKINVTDHYEVWDTANSWLDHTITINGTKYTIFKHFTEMSWSEAVQRFIEILNDQLSKQNKEDRVYLVSGGNDGRIIFLSDEQFKFIDNAYKNNNSKPLRLNDWIKAMDGRYMQVD